MVEIIVTTIQHKLPKTYRIHDFVLSQHNTDENENGISTFYDGVRLFM